MDSFQHLRIPLQDILSATNNFNDSHCIGSGGFGHVYKAHTTHGTVAVKRLDPNFDCEFLAEITMLARLKHPNLVSLLGFCDEADEAILVYEYLPNMSLDKHLSSSDLTWSRRLKIALDAAKGLAYLHGAMRNHVIHRDFKSSNILLDANWNAKLSGDFGISRTFPNTAGLHHLRDATANTNMILHRDIKSSNILLDENRAAKISDFGLSRLEVPSIQQQTCIVTRTFGYISPEYMHISFRTKATDVYSFGVVLFELLCGKLCFDNNTETAMWKKSYKQNKIQDHLIFNDLKQQAHGNSLEVFSDIAYKCLQASRDERPTMSQVVKALEAALDCQKGYKQRHTEDPPNYKDLLMNALEDPLNGIPETELKTLLLKGTLLNRGKTWFSLNKEGQHCEMISIAGCLTSASEPQHYTCSPEYNSRFAGGCYDSFGASFKTRVQAQFLSPGITYAVNLVFKNKAESQYIGLEYKLKGELSSCYSYVSDEREDGWLAAELYQFTSYQRTVDLEIWFYTECCPTMLVEGIEFRPLKKVEDEVLMDNKVDMQQPVLDSETYCEQKLPSDYEDMIKRSKDSVQWKTKEDLFSILCKGFQFSYGEEWFYLDKYGKKCLMLPARAILEEDRWTWNPEPETRFEEVACCNFDTFRIYCKFSSKMLSPQTTYTAFLVYELPDDHESVDQPPPVQVVDKDSDSKEVYNIFLRTPQTPVISWNEKEEKTFNPLNKPKIKGLPKLRSDGWMEVQVHEFQTPATIKMVQKKAQAHEFVKMVSMRLKLFSYDMSLKGVVVQGLEFRPAV